MKPSSKGRQGYLPKGRVKVRMIRQWTEFQELDLRSFELKPRCLEDPQRVKWIDTWLEGLQALWIPFSCLVPGPGCERSASSPNRLEQVLTAPASPRATKRGAGALHPLIYTRYIPSLSPPPISCLRLLHQCRAHFSACQTALRWLFLMSFVSTIHRSTLPKSS